MVLYIVGIVVALAGIVGFFGDPIIGILETNNIQNVVFVVLGLMIMMSTMKGHMMVTKIIGLVFAILGILGFVLQGDTVFGIVENTTNVNSFNLIVGVVVLVIAMMNKGDSHGHSDSAPSQPQMPPQEPQQPHNPQM